MAFVQASCPVCNGTKMLLLDPCPLCDSGGEEEALAHWCEVCGKALQSAKCLAEHLRGRKHSNQQALLASMPVRTLKSRMSLPALEEEELFEQLALGKFQNVVICTGAGVSTAAGIPDYRSPGGMYEEIRRTFHVEAEELLSRSFARADPARWRDEVEPWLRVRTRACNGASPTATHRFCAWLHGRGWLRRIYTQNVDGLHSHPELGLPSDLVVECHGALRDGSIVLYGDALPARFYSCCKDDFSGRSGANRLDGIDLLVVLGTSLQVKPFCAVPNLAPKGCVRVLVNRDINVCLTNSWSHRCRDPGSDFSGRCFAPATVGLGGHKAVPLKPLWHARKARKRWQQILIESSSDDFVARFFWSPVARELGLALAVVR